MSDKPSLARDGTMAVTAKIGREIIGKEQLGDTRAMTGIIKKTKKAKLPKKATMAKAVEEAKVVLGKDAKMADPDTPRQLRPRPARESAAAPPKKKAAAAKAIKPALKRPSTMAVTAEEGNEFLTRQG